MNNVIITGYTYEKGSNSIAQGSSNQIEKYERANHCYALRGGNGTYLMVSPSVARITFDYNGVIYEQSVKGLIREVYGVERVTRKRLETFVYDCMVGKIDLKYDLDRGLYI